MVSYSIDYLFNRVYDFLLWIKYTWLFTILHTKPEDYLKLQESHNWDGLRDRGWFNDYFAAQNAVVPQAPGRLSLWHRMLDTFGIPYHQDTVPDPNTDPSINQSLPQDLKYCMEEYKNHLTSAEIKERYEADFTFSDNVRDVFGISPEDTDKDGVPDSYENAHHLNLNDSDADHDGLSDGVELCYGTDPLNNDTDHDGILDGRDEAPRDGMISAVTTDSDGDGVSDVAEKYLGSDAHSKDTDHDNIPDGMDTYPTDFTNSTPLPTFDFSQQTHSLELHIQNPFLGFIAQLLSILAIVGLVFFILFLLWFIYEYWQAQVHYEHHFNDSHDHKGDGHGQVAAPAGIPGLPVGEYVSPHAPKKEEFEQHPRWAIIEGYMASNTEALWRIGILEADTMLAEVLADKGYKGTDVGEMLQSASFKTVRLAWDAHMMRNKIAHEGSAYVLTEREAKRAYALYEAVFKELKAI